MDKYLCSNPSSCSSSPADTAGGGGLLALMKKSRAIKAASSSSSSWSQQRDTSNEKWESASAPHFTLGDVNFQTRHQKFNRNNNNKGWRVIDGEKVYVTMRNEGVVKATGRDAFLLSKADEGKTKREKKIQMKLNDNADDDADTGKTTQKRKLPPSVGVVDREKSNRNRNKNKITDHLVKVSLPQQLSIHHSLPTAKKQRKEIACSNTDRVMMSEEHN